jgi:outer membrane protein assembly factor BamB
MNTAIRTAGALATCVVLIGATAAQDWPQWRGANRDAKVTGFTAPKTWPKELTKKWSEKVGEGVATPALVGDKLYVFTRKGSDEVISCRTAADGKEVWSDKYESSSWSGADSGFIAPRSSPAVADGKVVTLGAIGILSCYDTDGKKLWRKEDFKNATPMFHVASSPIIFNGLAIVQLGGGRGGSGGIFAFDLAKGDEKWKWTGDSPAYASPVMLTLGDTKALVAETSGNIVALNAADGAKLWETPFKTRYNASTPVVDGQTVIYSGSAGGGMRGGGGGGGGGGGAGDSGTKAVKLEKKDDKVTADKKWSNSESAVIYNTPIVKDGLVYGISTDNKLFCISEESGKTLWSAALPAAAGGGGGGGGRGGRGGMGGSAGYGSVVDAGTVLFALTPAGQLVVFEPSEKEYKEVTKYKVADSGTYAYPVVSGNRVFIKDKDSLTLYTIE